MSAKGVLWSSAGVAFVCTFRVKLLTNGYSIRVIARLCKHILPEYELSSDFLVVPQGLLAGVSLILQFLEH